MLFQLLEPRRFLAADLVYDIAPGTASSDGRYLVGIGSTLYFSATNESMGREMWVTNGTPGSTSPIETRPGPSGSNPHLATEAGGAVWFSANDGSAIVLYRSSGFTATPTDAREGYGMTEYKGKVYFGGFHKNTGSSVGYELYRINPDGSNLELNHEFQTGPFSGAPAYLTKTSNSGQLFGDQLFMAASSTADGQELFINNGLSDPQQNTGAFDIESGTTGSNPLPSANWPRKFTEAGGCLYLSAEMTGKGRELVIIPLHGSFPPIQTTDLNVGPGSSTPDSVVASDNGTRAYFTATSNGNTRTLWVAEGTNVSQVSTQVVSSYLAVVGDTVYFTSGVDLWKSNGTQATTQLVKAGVAYAAPVAMNGKVYFQGFNVQSSFELWESDGTSAGTIPVTDINPGSGSSSPTNLTNVNGTLYFTAFHPTYGNELWKYTSADVIPPQVTNGQLDTNGPSVVLTFSEAINPSTLTASDLSALNTSTNQSVPATNVTLTQNGTVARFTFNSTMPNGNYRFNLPAGEVNDVAGNPVTAFQLDGSSVFVMAGDVNHDRTVNFDDLLIVAQNYGQSNRTFSQGNVDNSPDGLVNFSDLLIIAQQYGTSLPQFRVKMSFDDSRITSDVLMI